MKNRESRDEYILRRFKEEEIALDPADREWEYDGDGQKVYKPESGHTRLVYSEKNKNFKYNELNLIEELKEYVESTYDQHYSKNKFQSTEFIIDSGHGTGFCIGNILKYAQRYGKKGNTVDSRKDILKILHYALIQLYIHDNYK